MVNYGSNNYGNKTDHFPKKSSFFRDTRDYQEHDAKKPFINT